MISNRPILYLTLPSLALIIGYVWLRRKKSSRVDRDTGGSGTRSTSKNSSCKLLGEGLSDNQELISNDSSSASYSNLINSHHIESLPIGTPQQHQKQLKLHIDQHQTPSKQLGDNTKQSQSPGSASSSSSLGKSAPIDIAPNPRSPPKRVTEQEIDCEILKLKPQESDIKNLRLIESPEIDWDASPTPADSPLYRDRYDMNRSNGAGEPVVVVKGTMEAKISPDNSFRERKYTKTESDSGLNGHNDSGSKADDEIEHEQDAEVVATTASAEVTEAQKPGVQQQQIASPSLSVCSMHTNDSGQGSSPPQSVGAPTVSFDFLVPIPYVGALIGYHGTTILKVKEKTGANVIIRKGSAPATNGSRKQKICSIEGTQQEVDAAIKMIREKLPAKKYPYLSMERIVMQPEVITNLVVPALNLQLFEGINNDVSISTIVSGGHVFLQQPLHPSYPALTSLQCRMNQWYSVTQAPELPQIIDGAICCAKGTDGNWYRVQIMSHDDVGQCVIKYLDFGGYSTVDASELRQIHADFMHVPFQAIECLLSNIRPPIGTTEWSKEAADTIASFTHGVILQAQIAGYTADEPPLPEIYLFVSITKDVSFAT